MPALQRPVGDVEGVVQVHVSEEINRLLNAAAEISIRRHQFFVGVEHLFEAILEASELLPESFVKTYRSALDAASREVGRTAWAGGIPAGMNEVFHTPRCAQVLNEAQKLAQSYKAGSGTAGHLLLALLADAHSAPSRALDRLELGRGDMIAALRTALQHTGGTTPVADSPKSVAEQPVAPLEAGPGFGKTGPLDHLTRNLTDLAREGKLEPAIAREDELFQVLQILARKNKNNVILVGEAGVGKTQIVEGIAVAAAHGGMNGLAAGYEIFELNMGALMAGTQLRGAFEQKLIDLLDGLKLRRGAVLFIDEVHLLMGAGATDGDAMDLANLLKPVLARGDFRCIGATTMNEYRRFVEKDPAIERRFQMIRIEPLSEEGTRLVLEKLQPSLERHHGLEISPRALDAAVALTARYMPNRHFPDKAIDVLDQACARQRLKSMAIRNTAGREAANRSPRVRPHDIRKVISQLTAVPIEEMTAEERIFLTNIEEKIKTRIIGQEEAVARVAAAVKKSRAGLSDPNRPQAVLLFIGPTGVGKTQLAKTLAELLFGSSSHLITFDLSAYSEPHSVSKLLGAPPGYVGSEKEGLLMAAVRQSPFSILLFDEVEKAHPNIFDALLPVFDEGRMKDSRGREFSFRNCIIILTSNIGAGCLHHARRGENVPMPLMEELRRHFRPEFINRLDDVVPFYPLLFEDIRNILRHSLAQLKGRLKEKNIRLHVYVGAYEYLAQEGYSPAYGAREINRTVDRLVVAPISAMILENKFVSGDIIDILIQDGALQFRKGQPDQVPVTT